MTAIARSIRSADFEADVDARLPVVLLLHGFGSNEQDLPGLVPAIGLRLPWASLRAPVELGGPSAAWFDIVAPGAPDPAPVAAATEAIWAWVDAHVGAAAQVVPIGFSQGGLMATQLLRTRPERVLAPVVLGGFALGDPQPADERLARTRPAAFWGRGALDRVITEAAVARTAEILPRLTTLEQRMYPGLAHGVDMAEVEDVRAFLAAQLTTEVIEPHD
jgi:phospholipase/carboxylesterase